MRKTLALAGLCALAGCASSSLSYAANAKGFAVTQGQCTKIENLNSSQVEFLSDGVAYTITQPGCRVTIAFGKERSQVIALPVGSVLVLASGKDYVLQPHMNERATGP